MTLEPHHAADRHPTDDEYTALKDRAERNARRLAADGMDPAEATLVGYGQAAGDQHRLRCPDHGPDRCVDDPGPNTADDREALAAMRADVLDQLRRRTKTTPGTEAQAARTVEHLRGDR